MYCELSLAVYRIVCLTRQLQMILMLAVSCTKLHPVAVVLTICFIPEMLADPQLNSTFYKLFWFYICYKVYYF